MDYEEEMNVGALGLFLLGRRVPQLKVPSKNICITNSSDILRYVYGITKNDPKAEAFLNPSPEAIHSFSCVCYALYKSSVFPLGD